MLETIKAVEFHPSRCVCNLESYLGWIQQLLCCYRAIIAVAWVTQPTILCITWRWIIEGMPRNISRHHYMPTTSAQSVRQPTRRS